MDNLVNQACFDENIFADFDFDEDASEPEIFESANDTDTEPINQIHSVHSTDALAANLNSLVLDCDLNSVSGVFGLLLFFPFVTIFLA